MMDILPMTHWTWLMLGLVLLVLELMFSLLYFLWLGAAALVTAGALYLGPTMGWDMQILLFSVFSIVNILLARRYLSSKSLTGDQSNLNCRGQQYVGRVFTLIEPIANGYGKIAVDDTQWRVTGPPLEAGASVRVVAANGSVLDVEQVESA